MLQAARRTNDLARVRAIGGREGWRLTANFLAACVPADFGMFFQPGPNVFEPYDFSFVDLNGLLYAWHAHFYAELERKTNPKRIYPNVTAEDEKECAKKLIEYVQFHIPTIIDRIINRGLWNEGWANALNDQNAKKFLAWVFDKCNPLRVHGNYAAHVMKRENVVRALRETAAAVNDTKFTAEDRFCIGLVGDLVFTGVFEAARAQDQANQNN